MASHKRNRSQEEEHSVQVRARNACASGQGSTTSELRDIARQLGIRNVSAMSKTKLCEAIHTNISQDEPAFPVTLDESDIPDGLQDPVSLELMQDPIVASDGYSYDRVSLRNLFVAEQRRFVAMGRPMSRPVAVRSLIDRDVVLANPFGDIGGLPATFPLVENKSLARTIAEWRTLHGFDAPDASEVGAAAAINSEPPESRRNDEEFQNGIFVGPGSFEVDEAEYLSEGEQQEEEEEEEEQEAKEEEWQENQVVRTRRTVPVWDNDDDEGFVAPEMKEVEFEEILFSPLREEETEELWFRHLWDNYQLTHSRDTLISMLIHVASEETMVSPLIIELGGIDSLKPDLAQNQTMYDWSNNVVRHIMRSALQRDCPILMQRNVDSGLAHMSRVLHDRQTAPVQFQLFLHNHSRSILLKLLKVVQHGSEDHRMASLSFMHDALNSIEPQNGNSWEQWKTMVLSVMEYTLDDQRTAVRGGDVRTVLSQE